MRVVTIARKPLSEGSVAANVLEHGTGALNIDGCRIITDDDTRGIVGNRTPLAGDVRMGPSAGMFGDGHGIGIPTGGHDGGRWPANVILIHKATCRPSGVQEIHGSPQDRLVPTRHDAPAKFGYSPERHQFNYAGETVTTWECAPSCPVAALDEQSGLMVSKKSMWGIGWSESEVFGGGDPDFDTQRGYDDVGGASRFFKQIQED